MAKEAPAIVTSKNSAVSRLGKAIKASDKRLEAHRRHSTTMLRAYCGSYYNNTPMVDGTRRPVNSLYSVIAIILPNLVGTVVKSRVTFKRPELAPFGSLLQLSIDHILDQIRYAETKRRAVMAALFSAGLVKSGIEVAPLNDSPDFPNWLQDAGWPFVAQFSIDNYIIDHLALCREAASFEGNKYLIGVEDAKASGLYNMKLLEEMDTIKQSQREGDDEKKANISRGDRHADEYLEYYCFADVTLHNEGVVVTVPGDPDEIEGYLRERNDDSPEGGEIDMLGFAYPTDNALPVPPTSMYYDMDVLVNSLTRKLRRQAERSKTVGLYPLGQEEDAEAIRSHDDGDLVGVRDPGQVRELTYGGADPRLYESIDWSRGVLDWLAGNPNILGGLNKGEKTLGQDEMKLSQAGVRMADMQAQVATFDKKVLRKVAWYLWNDPQSKFHVTQQLPSGIELSRLWGPEVREGEFPDFVVDVEPYVVSADNPMEQYRRTMELIERVVLPLAPLAQAQGVTIDVATLVSGLASNLDIETDTWYKAAPPQTLQQPQGAGRGGEQGSDARTSLGQGQNQQSPQQAAPAPTPQEAQVA